MGKSDLDRLGKNDFNAKVAHLNNPIGFLYRQIEKLRNCELISELEVRELCRKAKEVLIEESNVQKVDAPVTVR